MSEWLNSLSDPSFMPHGHCYLWRPEILWTHVISDAVIAIAYYAIPIVLAIFLMKQKRVIPYPEILGLFVAFIFLCGTTHLVAIYVTWNPLYEQQGWLKALTAIVSLMTAAVLVPKLPHLIALPGVQQALEETKQNLADVEAEKAEMKTVFEAASNREEKMFELKNEVNQLLKELGRDEKYLSES
jgi:hypothetical protein